MVQPHGLVAAVEIAHFAVLDVDRADGQPGIAVIEVVEIDEFGERLAQRSGGVVRGVFQPDLQMRTEPGLWIGTEER